MKMLGQAQNRLLNLKGTALLSRRLLYFQALSDTLKASPDAGRWPLATFFPNRLSSDILATLPGFSTLNEVKNGPSPDEIGDLALMDAFYGPLSTEQFEGSWGMHWSLPPKFFMCAPPQPGTDRMEKEGVPAAPISSDAFCCPPLPALPNPYAPDKPNSIFMSQGAYFAGYRFFPLPRSARNYFWDRSIGSPWAELKPSIPNYIEIERVLETYPFPQPFQRDYAFILGQHIIPPLRSFGQIPGVLNDTIIRMFLTMTVLEKYEPMTQALQNYLEEQADNEKRRRMVSMIGIAAVGALVGAGLAAAAVSSSISTMATKGLSSIADFHSKQQQADFAQTVQAASDAFKTEDPKFAAEVKFTADVFKFLAEDAGKLAQLSPEDQAKVAGTGDGIGILGIAGLGVGALALLYFAGAFD